MSYLARIASTTSPLLAPPLRLALLVLALPACAADARGVGDDSPTEKTGSTAEAVSWVGDAFWGQWGNGGPDADIGSAASMTCFHTGLHGQLLGSIDSTASGPPATARVYVDVYTNHWFLQTHQGVGNGVNVRVACVPYVGNRAFFSSSSGQMISTDNGWGVRSVVTIPQSSPNRQCFLAGLSSWNGFNQQVGQSDTYVWAPGPTSTGQNPNAWQFITDVANAVAPGDRIIPGGSAEAVCVDVGPVQGSVGPTAQSSVWWFSNQPNIACGLTMITGGLAYDPLGGNDGVGLSYGHGSPWWGINATSGKTVAATCFL
jgi:hypothetical protein